MSKTGGDSLKWCLLRDTRRIVQPGRPALITLGVAQKAERRKPSFAATASFRVLRLRRPGVATVNCPQRFTYGLVESAE